MFATIIVAVSALMFAVFGCAVLRHELWFPSAKDILMTGPERDELDD